MAHTPESGEPPPAAPSCEETLGGLSGRLSIVLDATADLNAMLEDTGRLERSLLERLSRAVPFSSGSLQVLEGDSFRIVAFRGNLDPAVIMGLRFPLDPLYPNHRVFTARRPVAFADIRVAYPHFEDRSGEFSSGHIRSWLGVPMIAQDAIIGMIALDRDVVDPFAPEDIRIVQAFADNAAVAIRNAAMYRELRQALAAKDQLMRELNHRVKNNLALVSSIISLQEERVPEAEARGILEEVRLRLDSIATAHSLLYKQADPGAGVDMDCYLRDVVEGFRSSFLGQGSAVEVSAELEPLDGTMKLAIPIGLILNELLTNTAKYAFPAGRGGRVTVRLRREGARALLQVADDGVGMAAGPEGPPVGFGTQLVRSLASQLQGSAELESRPGRTVWTIGFPAP